MPGRDGGSRCHRFARCLHHFDQSRGPRTPARTPRPFTSPSRGRWSTAASTATARDYPGKYTHAAALNKVHELESEGKDAFVWIGLHEPDEHQMQAVADVFCLHELAVEDAVHAHQRPKLERYDKTLFLVLKTVNYVEHVSVSLAREIVETGEIMIFVGPDFVVTVRHGEHSGLATVRKHVEASPALLKLGPYAVMHAIADHVVDSYLDVTDLVETDIDTMEEDIFSPMTNTNIECIYLLKREVVELRRAVNPLTPRYSAWAPTTTT